MPRILRTLAVTAALAASAALTSAAHAQTVAGRLLDPATELGIPSARVILLDAGGRRVASAVTDAEGAYSLTAPSGGRYTVRAERVGYHPTTSAPLVLSAGETSRLRLVAEGVRVGLQAIQVESSARCEVRPGSGAAAAAVWEEARKALDLAGTALAERTYRYEVTRYMRDLDPRSGIVVDEKASLRGGMTDRPFATVPPEQLASDGFLRSERDSLVYNVPDADVLLSDFFLDGHCFRVQPGGSGDTTRVGLAFEPRGRSGPDVRGVIWMDRRSAELRSVEYEYTRPPVEGPRGVPGGQIFFRRLPNGSWIVSRWNVRMPIAEAPVDGGYAQLPGTGRTRVGRIREEGGEVTAITGPRGEAVPTQAVALVTGVVWDSTRAAPAAGVRVFVTGTDRTATTDTAGRYVLRGLREGSYTLGMAGGRLDSLGYVAPAVPVAIETGATLRRDLAIPRMSVVLAAGCTTEQADSVGGGTLVGVLRDAATGVALPGGRVLMRWRVNGIDAIARASSDETGVYRFCDAPAEVPVSLTVSAFGSTLAVPDVRLARGGVLQRDVALTLDARGAAALRSDPTGAGVQAAAVQRGSTTQRVITRTELARVGSIDARRAVEQLRPLWTRARGSNVALTTHANPVSGGIDPDAIILTVYVDGQRRGGLTELAQISVVDVESMEFLDPAEAARRFGSDTARGVILVTTRGHAPNR
ncbi:MAG TPA: carboxypeptidase regulatory-like domain-containing protein [Longimicrobiaceae bacterium]|nr:carboxypeptidase regulatory-like domain-containing protein [Longimicrobiaceae bacterium]